MAGIFLFVGDCANRTNGCARPARNTFRWVDYTFAVTTHRYCANWAHSHTTVTANTFIRIDFISHFLYPLLYDYSRLNKLNRYWNIATNDI